MTPWTFDDEFVAASLELEMARSIPGFYEMQDAVRRVAKHFVGPRNLDIGTARGTTLAELLSIPGEGHFDAIEKSPAMVRQLREMFEDEPRVTIFEGDVVRCPLFLGPLPPYYSLVTSIFTLQFIPPSRRLEIMIDARINLVAGGAFILAEKVLGSNEKVEAVLASAHRDMKMEDGGLTLEEVDEKQERLKGVLFPITASENERMLKQAGFQTVETIWANLNFRAWLALP